MDCEQIKALLDAYSLGAAEPDEAATLEEHIADCVRCWSALDEAQRAAAAIALSTAFHRAPASLRRRIIAEAQRGERISARKLLASLARFWPAGFGLVAAGAVAALAFALVLQGEVSDLRDDNDQLSAKVESADARLTEHQQVMAVLAAPDSRRVDLRPTDPASSAAAAYHWSGSAGAGALLCNKLPPLPEGQMYQLWFLTDDHSHAAGSFYAWDGIGQLSVDLDDVPESAFAIGISMEDADGALEPSEMLLIADFDR